MTGRAYSPATPPDRCAHCGDIERTRQCHPCVCGGDHLICAPCKWVWRTEYTLDPCPLSDEFRVAAAAMGRA